MGVKGPYPDFLPLARPESGECENLLVPVCLSATHIAYGSIRMEPVFMILGESSAAAASLAIDAAVSVQKVDYAKLRELLLADGQILAWSGPVRTDRGAPAKKLPGTVLDDDLAKKTGEWTTGSFAGKIGPAYQHDGNTGKGEKAMAWTVDIPATGEYELIFHFTPNKNRATNVPVTVKAGGAPVTVKVDERKEDKDGAASLGIYKLTKGQPATVRVTNAETDGYVIVDGLQILPGK